MALIACPECGREKVSDSAISCPDCGFNIKEYMHTKIIKKTFYDEFSFEKCVFENGIADGASGKYIGRNKKYDFIYEVMGKTIITKNVQKGNVSSDTLINNDKIIVEDSPFVVKGSLPEGKTFSTTFNKYDSKNEVWESTHFAEDGTFTKMSSKGVVTHKGIYLRDDCFIAIKFTNPDWGTYLLYIEDNNMYSFFRFEESLLPTLKKLKSDIESIKVDVEPKKPNFYEIKQSERKDNSVAVTCPYCKSTNTSKIGALKRSTSFGLFGFGSSKIGKQWHCNSCSSDF